MEKINQIENIQQSGVIPIQNSEEVIIQLPSFGTFGTDNFSFPVSNL